MHFLEREKIMVIKLTSKFELRRLCRAVGATSLLKLDPPTPDELGFASSVCMKEVGSNKVIIVEQSEAVNAVGTILLRGATEQMMNDVERAVDDGTARAHPPAEARAPARAPARGRRSPSAAAAEPPAALPAW